MKKHLLLLLLSAALLGSTRSTAQPYQSIFGKDSTMWNFSVFEDVNTYQVKTYKPVKDTLINGIMYKLLNSIWKDHLGFNHYDRYAVREDTMQGKVWIRYIDSNYERLIMDLSMDIGDSIWFRLLYNPNCKVQSVHYDSKGRKVLTFNCVANYLVYTSFPHYEYLQFIEGMGNTAGFDIALFRDVDDAWLLCQYKDGQQNFTNPYLINCDTGELSTTLGINSDHNSKVDINVFPNPATDFANINGVQKEAIEGYYVYNSLGSLQKHIIASDKIDMTNLAPGVYYVKIIMKNKQTFFRKLIKLGP